MGLVFNHDDRPLAGYYGHDASYYAPPAAQPRGRGGWWHRAFGRLARRGDGQSWQHP
jgi:hypothetical protein